MFFVFCAAVASIAWIISGFTMSHNRGLAIWIGFVGIVFFEAICVRVYQVVTTENRSEQAQQSSATAVEEQQPPIKPDEKIEALTTEKPSTALISQPQAASTPAQLEKNIGPVPPKTYDNASAWQESHPTLSEIYARIDSEPLSGDRVRIGESYLELSVSWTMKLGNVSAN